MAVFAFVAGASPLKANEWLSGVMTATGGKGGGSAKYAQGSVSVTSGEEAQRVVDAAQKYLDSKL